MIRYQTTLEGIQSSSLVGFFDGWPTPPSPEAHFRILEGSQFVVLAVDGESVLGFCTAVSDGVFSAYIPLLEVLPEHRGEGIGRELIARMLDQLSHLYMVDLTYDAELESFYESLGFRPLLAMARRNYGAVRSLA